ncbi:hypothetical protein C0V70_05825 [Bacteriovorax stolpii]|uniref:Uncharacterized protein n=1 Tax=Bacteriovorax stolpii TaxID=960 RepID=A0A2K9NQ38_BACTC|nr:hypothetical protein [Bacteriovorax stolpii]AUN97640.1 hypothetical protein C0V70_05825 [Bacteriovorax stolpii]TDP52820.1 hypothetical protein C8D79_2587 [Bacteriovorax stolpii]
MKLKLLLAWAPLFLFGACSFKSDENKGPPTQETSVTELKVDPNGDSDGDSVKDGEEITRGSNPFVADLPELKIKFLQNYKVEVFYHPKNGDSVKDQKSIVIDTNVKDTNPDFKFRVGNVFARENALKKAASFARFPNHTKGVIEDRDFSWVSYPDIDPRFFHDNSLKYQDIFSESNVIDNIKITLSNQVKLNESPFFKEIKDLKLNFYFLNHETENYELLKTTSVDRHFQSGIFETFESVIENAPINLIKDSFFKRGEFIISEVDDYSIPAMDSTYKIVLKSVKAKSIPVLLETPLEEKFYYVASGASGIRFQDALKVAFDRNYEVREDSLIKIKEFQNNLPEFTYLSDVADKDKLGRWFVMTNEFKEHYLDHLYTPTDRIVLSYNVGSELAYQQNEQFYAYEPTITSNRDEIVMPLGNANQRSIVNIQLKPINRFGTAIENEKIRWETPSSCGKNCIPKHMVCHWDINKYTNYDDALTLTTDLTGEAEKLYLVLDGEEFKMTDLLKEKKIQLYKVGNSTHLEIKNLSKIKEIKPFDEVNLSLKLRALKATTFFGVKLVGVEGDWRGLGGCPFNTPQVAETRGTQVSRDTLEVGEINWLINDLANRGYPYRFKLMDSGDYFQEIKLGVSSTVINYYN